METKISIYGTTTNILSKDHLNIDNSASIINNYVVTEKADGYRYLLFIDEISQRGYLISGKRIKYYKAGKIEEILNVVDTGIIFKNVKGSWLLDGEYITQDKDNKPINMYMIFDVYYADKEYPSHPYTYPFISSTGISRYNILMQDFKNNILSSTYNRIQNVMDIYIKDYNKGLLVIQPRDSPYNDKIFIESKSILNKSFLYKTDGLIYLPANLPVGSDLCGIPREFINGQWNLNYKYKPPHENTIDFRIRTKKYKKGNVKYDQISTINIENEDGTVTSAKIKKLQLFVSYNNLKIIH